MQLDDGVLIVLPRNEAKTFFAYRDDTARLEFIEELLQNDTISKFGCDGQWNAIHDTLSGIALEDSVLGQAILGGRPLHQGDDYHVCLVRPDVVGYLCEQAKQVDVSDLADLAEAVRGVFEIYRTAAELRAAMVFAVKRH